MPAHHKPTASGVRDPHCGPLPGDASYRLHFPDAQAFGAAMKLAAALEAKGLHRRAWRVRWNLDGSQPVWTKPPREDDAKPAPPPPNPLKARNGRITLALDPEHREAVQRLIKQSQLSHRKLGIAIGMSQQAVSSWAKGDYISEESYKALKDFVEGMKK